MGASRRFGVLLAVIGFASDWAAVDAAPARRHHRHALVRHVVVPQAPETEQRSAAAPRPQAERDGVSGNLPFDNQLRKLSDPLNANGR